MSAFFWTLLQATPLSPWLTLAVAVIAAIPATAAAWIAGQALAQGKRNAEVSAQTAAAVNDVKKDGTANGEKLTEIHTLTNSNLSKVQTQLDVQIKNVEGLNQALAEAGKRIANMELLITSLVPEKGKQSPSAANGEKLDKLQSMLSNVQAGTPPIPVVDEAVLAKLSENDKKLDTIQETVDHPVDKKPTK